ncbi:bifunctional phosphopantothenoylcysteine decarboxylase/phosphopantothenate--cysteine ligase CoaBC [Candidatus Woesearchaeota archaeon CG10_big_fil_rev_8_21_14_0_10_34_8]|nr:MAG: bifunctional phosphopantothenoylcysteine decarboxylase/phosphopantothenate--cysteine ligase CoaBC [Candidatus Woesearchaeota archaeon CG10_big_fil_rev_8_21_14_0_10_34_8]
MNQDLQVENLGNYLEGKKVALCVTGGIASIETPKIARHLRRYGADVTAYVTSSALKFIGETSLEWATGKPVVKELSGLAEHICTEDIVLVTPATLNTINKMYSGIADDPVTTLIASVLGNNEIHKTINSEILESEINVNNRIECLKPVLLAPTMHESLYNNPFLKNNLENKLNSTYGIHIIKPRFEEHKAKLPKIEDIVAQTCHLLNKNNKKLLVTGGATPVKIDDVRIITNKFKGNLAIEIAKEAYHKGYEVTLLLGNTGLKAPSYLRTIYHADYDDYYDNVFKELNGVSYDFAIFSAAVADYAPEKKFEGKIHSLGELEIKFKQTKKIINEVRKKFPDLFMITFKHLSNISEEDLLNVAKERTKDYQIVVANREEDMKDNHKAFIVTKESITEAYNKKDIAKKVIEMFE